VFSYGHAIAGKTNKYRCVKGKQKYNRLDQPKEEKCRGEIMAEDAECGHLTALPALMPPGTPGHQSKIISVSAVHPVTFRVLVNYYLLIFFLLPA
jgi:hypothetical protein